MIKVLGLLFILSACSSLPPGAVEKKIPAHSATDARRIIQNKVNFITSLFEQTIDPYYNVPKWNESCLKANQIGALEETESFIRSTSYLYLKNGEPGVCPQVENARRHAVIYVFCKNQSDVREVKIPLEENQKFEENLCH